MSRPHDRLLTIAEEMLERKLTRKENYHLSCAVNKCRKVGGVLYSRQAVAVLLQCVSALEATDAI